VKVNSLQLESLDKAVLIFGKEQSFLKLHPRPCESDTCVEMG
jgi:hypothetical protein